jgi:cell division protease FtsH
MNSTARVIVFWFIIVLSAFLLWQVVRSGSYGVKGMVVGYSEFLSEVESGKVSEVTISRNQVQGRYQDGSRFEATVPSSQEGMLQTLRQNKVNIVVRDDGENPATKFWNLAPILLLAVLWFYMIRQIKRGQVQAQNQMNRIEPH